MNRIGEIDMKLYVSTCLILIVKKSNSTNDKFIENINLLRVTDS